MRNSPAIKFLIFILLAVTTIVYLVPLLYVLNISLMSEKGFMSNPLSITKTLNMVNYVSAWEKAHFGSYILNSLLYTSIGTVLSMVFSMLIAFPIARKYIKYSGFFMMFFLSGLFLPDGTIPLFQIILKMNLYNTRIGYIITMIVIGGIQLIFYTSYFKSIPRELDESASIDGCGYFRFFFSIIVPLSKPAIASMSLLTAINIWNDLVRSTIFISNDRLMNITRGLFAFKGNFSTQWTEMTAALVIVATPLIILFVFAQKYIMEGAAAGAVKG